MLLYTIINVFLVLKKRVKNIMKKIKENAMLMLKNIK